MDVPVVAAAGLEGNVGNGNLEIRHLCQPTASRKIAGIGFVGLTDREYHLPLETGEFVLARNVIGPDVFCEAESRPGLGPTGVERHMCYDFGNLATGDAVFTRYFKMGFQ